MAEQPRGKGQFVQAWMLCFYPATAAGSGSPVSHDGTFACDTVFLQADYPHAYGILGTAYNDPTKGDDPATQFRTPSAPTWSSDPDWIPRIRF